MKKRFLFIFLIVFLNKLTIAQKNDIAIKKHSADKWYFSFNGGLWFPFIYNNSYSKIMTDDISMKAGLTVFREMASNRNKKIFIDFSVFNHYKDESKNTATRLLNSFGEQAYGDIVLNDWTEWQFGLGMNFLKQTERNLTFSTSISLNFIAASRSKYIYRDSMNSHFIYAHVDKFKLGLLFNGGIGIHYNFPKNNSLPSIELLYNLSFGKFPAEYTIRYGTGSDHYSNYMEYDYKNRYTIFRQLVEIKVIFNLYETIHGN
jgi:hypothetical protein